MPDKEDGYPYRINKQGEPFPSTMFKVFLEVEDNKTEFEYALEDILLHTIPPVREETLKDAAAKLLTVARKEIAVPYYEVDIVEYLKKLTPRIFDIAALKYSSIIYEKETWLCLAKHLKSFVENMEERYAVRKNMQENILHGSIK